VRKKNDKDRYKYSSKEISFFLFLIRYSSHIFLNTRSILNIFPPDLACARRILKHSGKLRKGAFKYQSIIFSALAERIRRSRDNVNLDTTGSCCFAKILFEIFLSVCYLCVAFVCLVTIYVRSTCMMTSYTTSTRMLCPFSFVR